MSLFDYRVKCIKLLKLLKNMQKNYAYEFGIIKSFLNEFQKLEILWKRLIIWSNQNINLLSNKGKHDVTEM